MKKVFLLCALTFSCALHASAQANAGYRFDNFDTRDGVRIEVPEPVKPAKPTKKLKLTARSYEAAKTPGTYAPEATSPATPGGLEMAAGRSLDGFSTGDPTVDSLIVASSRRHGVDPVLIYSIMHRESAFKKRALSHKGASGLMQLMPATARRFGVSNIWDPRENIDAGARYMRWLLDKFDGDVRLALAGYNAGEGAVMKYGWRVPPYSETQEYVRRITQRYSLMRDPATARRAPAVSRTQIAKIKAAEQQQPAPVYEQHVFAVRMPDGKLRLVSQ